MGGADAELTLSLSSLPNATPVVDGTIKELHRVTFLLRVMSRLSFTETVVVISLLIVPTMTFSTAVKVRIGSS